MMRLFILFFLAVILYCLGSALFYLVRERSEKDARGVVRALSWRIGLSLGLFFLLLIFYALGWIHPHGVGELV